MSLAALARQMHEAGTPMEGILLALEAVEARDNEAADRRAKTAARKQAQRDRERDSHVTVTGHDADNHDQNPSLDKSPQTPKINPNPGVHTHDAPARRAATWPCPEGVDPTHWRDFLTNRKHKRCAVTETARLGVMRSLADIADDEWPPGRLVEHAAAKGWASINDPRENAGPRNARQQQKPANDGLGSTVRSGLDALRILEQRTGH